MSPILLIDTNLVVRYLVADNAQYAKAASKIFESCDRGEVALVLLPTVLSECVFVLESFYKLPRRDIASVLTALIESPGITTDDAPIHVDALTRYHQTKLHFVDCSLAAFAAARRLPVVSFDRDFGKFRDIETVNPLS